MLLKAFVGLVSSVLPEDRAKLGDIGEVDVQALDEADHPSALIGRVRRGGDENVDCPHEGLSDGTRTDRAGERGSSASGFPQGLGQVTWSLPALVID